MDESKVLKGINRTYLLPHTFRTLKVKKINILLCILHILKKIIYLLNNKIKIKIAKY